MAQKCKAVTTNVGFFIRKQKKCKFSLEKHGEQIVQIDSKLIKAK